MEHTGQVQILFPGNFGEVRFGFVHSICQAQRPKVFLKRGRTVWCENSRLVVVTLIHWEALWSLVSCIFYLQIVTDFHADFGQRQSYCCLLQLAHPRVQLLLGQHLLQSLQGLHLVGHDEHHTWLLVSQRHAQDGQLIGAVIIEAIETCGNNWNLFQIFAILIMHAFLFNTLSQRPERVIQQEGLLHYFTNNVNPKQGMNTSACTALMKQLLSLWTRALIFK